MPFIKINQYPDGFSAKTDKQILKCKWKVKRPHKAKTILRKKKKARGNIPLGFKLYYKATANKTVWCWTQNRHINQWKRIESQEINPYLYG